MMLSIVIPAYNEEKRISSTLEKYLSHYASCPVEFIVVLNACTDNTRGVVDDFIKRFPGRIRYIEIPDEIGKGGAVKAGFQVAHGDNIGFLDADGSTDPAEYEKLIREIDRFDCAIASRWKRGSEVVNRKLIRNIVSFGFISFVRILFWMPFADTQCGAKVFRRKVIEAVLPKLTVHNMAFDIQLLQLIRKAGFTITEVPTRWVDKSSSALLGSPMKLIINSFRILATLVRIRITK
ncbi:MAG: glycosyltransferase family 2 protein [Patescibacteria group bacterium]|nr:glycosyltransferase family 2 protein [Patescibacteria group bacterium]MDD5715151.1 glycosyltransferase family 2 protein [Patescibacteria group bacterium]